MKSLQSHLILGTFALRSDTDSLRLIRLLKLLSATNLFHVNYIDEVKYIEL